MASPRPLAAPATDAPVHATEATQAADAAFRAIYEKEWAWRASEFGFAADEDEKGDADMPRLPDVGPAAQQRRLAVWEDVLAQLETLDPAALSPAEQVNYAVYTPQGGNLAASIRFRDSALPCNSDSSFWSKLSFLPRRPMRAAPPPRNP